MAAANTQTYKAKQEKRKKHTCNYKREKEKVKKQLITS